MSKVVKLKRKKSKSLKGAKYHRLKLKGKLPEKGLAALKKAHGKNLGVTCLFCHDKLKSPGVEGGRPRALCKKKSCFKKLRCAYRYDWEAASPAFKKMQKAA